MVTVDDIEAGATYAYTRTFTTEEVREFAALSRDEGYHHLVAEEGEAVVVHGLLTATLPTKLGGDLDFLARTMEFEFPRPVYTGEAITCELTIDAVEERESGYDLAASFVCRNEADEVVMSGRSEGVVFA